MFKKILIANRGEIACRVIKTAHKMGINTVAVYSEADKDALFVEMADEGVCIGPAASKESYLVIDKIIAACKQTGAEAVHPGYGFLSENAEFSRRLEEEGVKFIGPKHYSVAKMGDKIESKKLAIEAGVNTIPGYNDAIAGPDEAVAAVGVDLIVDVVDNAVWTERRNDNSMEATVFTGEGGYGITAITDPRYFVPIHGQGIYANAWAISWLEPNNPAGVVPPQEILDHIAKYQSVLQAPTSEQRISLMKEVLQFAADQFWVIGISSATDAYRPLNAQLGNVPEAWVSGWNMGGPAIAFPEQCAPVALIDGTVRLTAAGAAPEWRAYGLASPDFPFHTRMRTHPGAPVRYGADYTPPQSQRASRLAAGMPHAGIQFSRR